MIKRGQKRKETALNDRNLPLKSSSSQSFYPLRVFGENSSQCNLTGRLENVEMCGTDAQYAKSLISFQNSYSLLMLTSTIDKRGPRISPGYYDRSPRLLSNENKRKIEPKEISSCLTPCLIAVFMLSFNLFKFKGVNVQLREDASFFCLAN